MQRFLVWPSFIANYIVYSTVILYSKRSKRLINRFYCLMVLTQISSDLIIRNICMAAFVLQRKRACGMKGPGKRSNVHDINEALGDASPCTFEFKHIGSYCMVLLNHRKVN